MVFKRFVEIGRVALINTGPSEGKLCVIIDVIDQRRGLVTGPTSGVVRQPMNFAHLNLLDIKIRIPRSARDVTVKKAWEKAEVTKQWEETSYAKRLVKRLTRASLTDFDRFKLMVLKKQKSKLIRGHVKKLKKTAA
ncbi:hypothetical protein EMCRGX_G030869 [Ephydatia muelleri]